MICYEKYCYWTPPLCKIYILIFKFKFELISNYKFAIEISYSNNILSKLILNLMYIVPSDLVINWSNKF